MAADSINNWQDIMRLCCATQKTINITSYGDWDFSLYRKRKDEVARPIDEIIKQQILSNHYCCYSEQGEYKQIQIQEYPQYDNAEQALSIITVQINYSEQQFKQLFGFWEIKDFKVYNRDGNSSICSFEDDNYFYFGSYGTS